MSNTKKLKDNRDDKDNTKAEAEQAFEDMQRSKVLTPAQAGVGFIFSIIIGSLYWASLPLQGTYWSVGFFLSGMIASFYFMIYGPMGYWHRLAFIGIGVLTASLVKTFLS